MNTFPKKPEEAYAEARALGTLISLAEIAIDHMDLDGTTHEEYSKNFRKKFFETKLKEAKNELKHLGV